MRQHKHRSSNKRRKKWMRERDARKRAQNKEMKARDARITAQYGPRAHQMCGRKIRYGSKTEALARANMCVCHGTVQLRAYKCPYCDGWHLTSQQ